VSRLDAYLLKHYSRWIPFDICSKELLFPIEIALDASIQKRCVVGERTVISKKVLAPTYRPAVFNKVHFAIPPENIDHIGERLLYTELAKLLNYNLHLGVNNG